MTIFHDRSVSSKVIDFGTNQKHVCDFLLVRHSNLDPILHRFRYVAGFVHMTPPLFHPSSGAFPLDQNAHVGVSPSINLKLFGRDFVIFEVFQPMWSRYLDVTDRRTDRRTDRQTDDILCVASRGKNDATLHVRRLPEEAPGRLALQFAVDTRTGLLFGLGSPWLRLRWHAPFLQNFNGLLFGWAIVNVPAKFKVRSFTVPEIIGGTQKHWAVPGYTHAPFSLKILMGFCSDRPCECTGQIWSP